MLFRNHKGNTMQTKSIQGTSVHDCIMHVLLARKVNGFSLTAVQVISNLC